MVDNKGIRDGVKKEDIVKSLNEDDWKRIRLMKELPKFEKDSDAFACAVRTDQAYQSCFQMIAQIDQNIFTIASAKGKIDHNSQDLLKNDTIRIYPGTNQKMTMRDIQSENIHAKWIIGESIRNIYVLVTNLFKYVDTKMVDGKELLTLADFRLRVDYIKSELKKYGVDLYEWH